MEIKKVCDCKIVFYRYYVLAQLFRMYPVIAIVGRPNTGKSTLFNFLTEERKAITAREAGTTRDRIYGKAVIRSSNTPDAEHMTCTVVDTGGIEIMKTGIIEDKMREQAETAIREADIILFLVDSREEITAQDHEAAIIIRKSGKKILLVAGKSDSGLSDVTDFISLGFGIPISVSVFQKTGIRELHNAIFESCTALGFSSDVPEVTTETETDMVKVAFVGRPNVGKSSLLNAYFDDEKVIVSEIPGTTRDAADYELNYKDAKFFLIDTAGIRRRGAIETGIEKFSVARSLQALDRADVAVLLLDAREGITRQDMHVADYILKRKVGLIIAVNKIDLVKSEENYQNEWRSKLKYQFDFTPWAAVVFISAKDKKNIEIILDLAIDIKKERGRRIPTRELNLFLQDCMMKHQPTGSSVGIPKALYFTQVDTNPPHFVLFVNKEERFHFSYYRFLENQLRERYGFLGTPIRLELKGKEARRRSRKKYEKEES